MSSDDRAERKTHRAQSSVNKRKSCPTSLYEIESREADEKLAEARMKETARREDASQSVARIVRETTESH